MNQHAILNSTLVAVETMANQMSAFLDTIRRTRDLPNGVSMDADIAYRGLQDVLRMCADVRKAIEEPPAP